MDDKEKLFRTIDQTFHSYAEQYLDERIPILSRETIVRALWSLYERGKIRLVPDENEERFTIEWRRTSRREVQARSRDTDDIWIQPALRRRAMRN